MTSSQSTSEEQTTQVSSSESSTRVISSTSKEISDTTEAATPQITVETTEVTTDFSFTSSAESSMKSSMTHDESEKAPTPSTIVFSEESTTAESLAELTTLASTPSDSLTTTSTSTFKPPTTDEIFTLLPGDITNGTETDCKSMKCYNGGSCVVTTEGPKCVCRFDRQDPNCRSLIRIKNAAFAGDSYLSHMIYSDNHKDFDIKPLDDILPINIELKARSRATDGLILLAIAQGTKGVHYTALFLHKGLLQFQFSCGLQTMLLSELEAPINTGHEFTVQVALDFSRNHSHCNASLRINDTLAMSGDQPTWLGMKTLGKAKTVNSVWLHLGGSPQTPVVLMSDLPGGQGFTGCLHSLKVNDNYKDIFRFEFDVLHQFEHETISNFNLCF
jgi:protein eyes shut